MLYIENDVINITRGDDAFFYVPIMLPGRNKAALGKDDYLIFAVKAAPDAAEETVLEIVGEKGKNRIRFRHADTADLNPGFYSAEIQLVLADGQRVTLWPKLTGNKRVSADNWKNFCVMREVVTK